MSPALVGCLLLAGAVVLAWPGGAAARRRLFGPGVLGRGSPAPESISPRRSLVEAGRVAVMRRPRRTLVAGVVFAAGLGLLAGGPVAAAVVAAYAGLAGRAVARRAAGRREKAERSAALDGLATLAADLRAGLPPGRAGTDESQDRIGRLTSAVWRLAERTGAPAADLVERIEADARALDRAAASAGAQAAGAQATALLLAALPLGGIGLGIAIGADPVGVLLHTTLGAACALGAVGLQCGGLLWADRLVAS